MLVFGGFTFTLAKPDRSSMAAKAVFKSDFQDAINRLQTKDVAWPKRPWAVSKIKTNYVTLVKLETNKLVSSLLTKMWSGTAKNSFSNFNYCFSVICTLGIPKNILRLTDDNRRYGFLIHSMAII